MDIITGRGHPPPTTHHSPTHPPSTHHPPMMDMITGRARPVHPVVLSSIYYTTFRRTPYAMLAVAPVRRLWGGTVNNTCLATALLT